MFANPSAPTHCALIVLQEIFGVTSKIRRYCEMFARDSYAAMAPDLFWRMEPGVQLGYGEADIQRAMNFLHQLDEDRALDDVVACAKLLRSQGLHPYRGRRLLPGRQARPTCRWRAARATRLWRSTASA